jgi:lipid II:glycine glycyltransferase (peptidoglycan interpeptide bridge formation enzyme)
VPALGYAERIAGLGFHPIEEIQPSRHRLSVRLGHGVTEDAALDNVAKSTRQRIRQAERDGLAIVRHDKAATDGTLSTAGYEDVAAPTQGFEVAIARFHELALQTADRRHFVLGSRASFLDWTVRAYEAGHLILLLAADDGGEAAPVAGLMLYRHGGRLSTALSGDRPDAREQHPGAFHLLRWRAIQLAIREHAIEMDLGGVDVAGARHEPKPGEPMHGLYQHKRSFGAEWVELPGAHERVIRPARYLLGRVAARVVRR